MKKSVYSFFFSLLAVIRVLADGRDIHQITSADKGLAKGRLQAVSLSRKVQVWGAAEIDSNNLYVAKQMARLSAEGLLQLMAGAEFRYAQGELKIFSTNYIRIAKIVDVPSNEKYKLIKLDAFLDNSHTNEIIFQENRKKLNVRIKTFRGKSDLEFLEADVIEKIKQEIDKYWRKTNLTVKAYATNKVAVLATNTSSLYDTILKKRTVSGVDGGEAHGSEKTSNLTAPKVVLTNSNGLQSNSKIFGEPATNISTYEPHVKPLKVKEASDTDDDDEDLYVGPDVFGRVELLSLNLIDSEEQPFAEYSVRIAFSYDSNLIRR